MILEDKPLTDLLEVSKCLDTSSALIRGNADRKDYAYVMVKLVPCVLDPDPGVKCAPIRDYMRARISIEGYAITRKVMLSDKEDSLKNRMIDFETMYGDAISYELATNSLTLEEDMIGFITS